MQRQRPEQGYNRLNGARIITVAALVLAANLAGGCGNGSTPGASTNEAGQSLKTAAPRESDPPGDTGGATAPSRFNSTSVQRDGVRTAQSADLDRPSDDALAAFNASQTASSRRPAGRIYRRSDERPVHDDARLAARGIRAFESRRLKLYTDIDPEIARTLPPVIDAAWDAWVEYFGPLPPDREGREFQITGYVMADQALFREMGLVPEHLPPFQNGRHWENRLWMHDRPSHYYRRHLMIHEATHCFMTASRDMRSLAPMWYFEGMAELFGTHRLHEDGRIEFRIMPHSLEEVADSGRNLGRIELVQRAVAEGRPRPMAGVLAMQPRDFADDEGYAWSWAVCKLLDTHPRYRERFRALVAYGSPRAFTRAFEEAFSSGQGPENGPGPEAGAALSDQPGARLSSLDSRLSTEWTLFIHNLQHGYDIERAAIDFRRGRELTRPDDVQRVEITADRGWQSSDVRVEAGRAYRIQASGRFTLAEEPRPWISEPQGISFRYFVGQPLGRLLGTVRPDEPVQDTAMLAVTPLGRDAKFTPTISGTLYLRLNDSWSELADNSGHVEVAVQVAGSP